MNKLIKPLFLMLSLGFATLAIGQPIHRDFLERAQLEYVNNLPKYLTQAKSIVVMIADSRSEATAMAEETHPGFVKSGIDAAGYYHVDDLFANQWVSEQLAEQFEKRDVKYIIVLDKKAGSYTMAITAFSKSTTFITLGNKAWRLTEPSISNITTTLYRQAYALERENFLIIDNPEYMALDVKLKARRYEAYKPDLKSEVLAVKYNNNYDLSDSSIVLSETDMMLRKAFENYPYPHKFVSGDITISDLKKQGLRYVLEQVHSTNQQVRSILGYTEKADVTEYVSVKMTEGQGSIERIPADKEVFKYYIYNLPSNSAYVGTKWDADLTWLGALHNHIQLLIAEID